MSNNNNNNNNNNEEEEESWIHKETCCHSDSSEIPSANAGVKSSQKNKIIKTKERRKTYYSDQKQH